jgi:hypothetical protein
MPKIIGVQIFDILEGGCLNGTYINADTNEVCNEIARKTDASIKKYGTDNIEGEYG